MRKLLQGATIAVFAAMAMGAAANEGMGTYRMNPAKSKFSPADGAPKSAVATFERAGKDAVKVTVDQVGADGKAVKYTYTAGYDGKEVPITGFPAADKTTLKRIDPYTTVRTDTKGGKVISTMTRTVAKDGKSMTVDIKATTPKGDPVAHKVVFDRQ